MQSHIKEFLSCLESWLLTLTSYLAISTATSTFAISIATAT